jgi:hypothetical protein
MNFELARQLVVDWKDEKAVEALLESDGIFLASYGDTEDWIVGEAAEAIGISKLSWRYADDGEYCVRFGDRLVRVPPEPLPGVPEMLLRTLNETLSPEYEIRLVRYGLLSTSLFYMPLDGASWLKLEEEFGAERLDQVFGKLKFDAPGSHNRKPVATRPVVHRLPREKKKKEFKPNMKFADKLASFHKMLKTQHSIVWPVSWSERRRKASPRVIQEQIWDVPILTTTGFIFVGWLHSDRDVLVTLDDTTNSAGTSKVDDWGRRSRRRVQELGLRMPNGSLEYVLVPDHLCLKGEDGKWQPQKSISDGSSIMLHDGDFAKVVSVENKPGRVDVVEPYFEHAPIRTYCYGEQGIWVGSALAFRRPI